ncbi:PKD domain-containing protein [Flammeovirga aprica]|uniref:T9SS type A sorting domain-containing protein n=1 Tax=Flammeovirga aprica JL-4 TaxID=694437 RepID=A0A7X9RQG3_9BACT|nr:carboxypeptidase regulatory-like domain-containing protein [Flammeovirga aprica]NME66753.1 T9SS type A sorting domain-containing protein [Flammeovirga aprica JL-4]
MSRLFTNWHKYFLSCLFICMLGSVFVMPSFGQTTVKINPKVQRFIGNVSELERNKYFNLHSSGNDADVRQFFSDYNVFPSRGFWGPYSYSKSKGNPVGTYPSSKSGNDNVRNVTRFVGTEHPKSVFLDGVDPEKAGDWAVEYYKNYVDESGRPEFFEPMNEPFVHAVDFYDGQWIDSEEDRIKRQMAQVFASVGKKIHAEPTLAKMKVIGYSAAWPSMELKDFRHWDENMKLFMDIAGADMDAFATHLYDGVNVTGQNNLRSGSNSEAILDLIETYSFIKWGIVKPHAITEYGGITKGFEDHFTDLESIQAIRSINHMLFNLLDRENVMDISIPFITDKSQWHMNAGNNYQPYGAALFIPTNIGEANVEGWRFSPRIHFYELWKNIEGRRIKVETDNPDVQVHGFVKGNTLFIAFNNLDNKTQTVQLNFEETAGELVKLTTKSLKIYDDIDPVMSINEATSAPASLELIAGETVVLEYEFEAEIKQTSASKETKYYSTTYLQPIKGNTTLSFGFSNVTINKGTATLLMGIGRKHDRSKQPTIKVNGTAVNVPDNWKGQDQAHRDDFFGVIEIPVDLSLLKEENTVEVTFPDDGGHVSSLILEVKNDDATVDKDEAIHIESPKTEVIQSQEVKVKLSYNANVSRDIVAEFWSSEGWIAETRATVQAGEGEKELMISLPNLPELGGDYIIKSSIRPVGSNWQENIARHQINNISVVEALSTTSTLKIIVLDTENQPLQNALVALTNENQNFNTSQLTNENGVASFDVTPNADYNYIVTKENFNESTGTVTANQSEVEKTVALSENITIIPLVANAGEDQTVDAGELVALDASASSPEGITFQWTTISSIQLQNSTSANPTFTAPEVDEETTFVFEVNISKEDQTDADQVNITVVPRKDNEIPTAIGTDQNSVKIYPNPVHNVLNIDVAFNAVLFMYDVLGNKILEQNLLKGKNNLNLSYEKRGVYIIYIHSDQEHQSFKLIKE